MRTIYVDAENHCHVTGGDGLKAVETDYFDGKCDEYVEGYFYDVEKGILYPFVPFDQLENAQREYEKRLLAEYEAALNIVGVTA
jgi:hypothetical protein